MNQAKTQLELRLSDDYTARIDAATNPSTPSEVLTELSRDNLSRDNSYLVRAAVARNPSTSAETLIRLSRDRSWNVLIGVVHNPSAPVEAVENLLQNRKLRDEMFRALLERSANFS